MLRKVGFNYLNPWQSIRTVTQHDPWDENLLNTNSGYFLRKQPERSEMNRYTLQSQA